MTTELYIQLHQDVTGSPDDILADFPFDEGQRIISFTGGLIVVDLGEADDTNTMQEWYLNSSEDVQSFYVVED
jgi:hypothetical protein